MDLSRNLIRLKKDVIDPAFLKDWPHYKNRAANFLKHAHRDPDESLTGVKFELLNESELIFCSLALMEFDSGLSGRLDIGLMHCGISSSAKRPKLKEIHEMRGMKTEVFM